MAAAEVGAVVTAAVALTAVRVAMRTAVAVATSCETKVAGSVTVELFAAWATRLEPANECRAANAPARSTTALAAAYGSLCVARFVAATTAGCSTPSELSDCA